MTPNFSDHAANERTFLAWERMHLLMRHISKPETYPFISGGLGLFMAMATTALSMLVVLFGLHMI